MLLLLSAVAVAPAQEESPLGDEPGGPPDAELRRAMQEYFHNQLRIELSLSDEQMSQLVPKIERIEQARGETRRERAATVRRLQRGLREGGADDELQLRRERLGDGEGQFRRPRRPYEEQP
jgi:hypothetical protein